MAPLFTGSRMGGFGKNPDVIATGPSPVPVNIYLWGGYGGPGRSGAPESGGWVQISGTAAPGTTIGYIVGQYTGSKNFYTGGGGAGNPSHGGGFSAAFIGPVTPGNADSYILGLAGGAGGGGNDGYGDARGGYGGGPIGSSAYESPNQGLRGGGASQVSGGSPGGSSAEAGTKWLGGNARLDQQCGGGGGGYYGGGGGASNSSYDAGGGGGSGYVNTGTITQPGFGSFTITTTANNSGRPAALGHNNPTSYPSPIDSSPGKVVIEVNGVAVVNTTSSPPGSNVNTYVIP